MKDMKYLMERIRCISMERDEQKKQEMIEEIKKDPVLSKLFDEMDTLFGRWF
jgi:hypothetical protein